MSTTGAEVPRHGALPPGYREVRQGSARVAVWDAAATWVRTVLASGTTLHGWASARAEGSEARGRGQVYAVPAAASGPDDRRRWAVRHYRRGGAMAMHMEDRYLRAGRPRPLRELEASTVARARGIATPAVVAGATYLDGLYYRCDLATEWVEDAPTLAEVLHREDGTRGWLDAMARAGGLIRQLGRGGIFHVDLNARNILLGEDGVTWVIDLDRARVLRRAAASTEDRMVARLTRSVVKIGTPTGELLSDREVLAALTTGLESA